MCLLKKLILKIPAPNNLISFKQVFKKERIITILLSDEEFGEGKEL